MNPSGDAAEQVVRMSLDGAEHVVRIAGAGAKNIASLLLAAIKTQRTKSSQLKVSGQERLKRMLKSGKPLDVFLVREQDIKTFMREAKKYGIVYCAIRSKEPQADGMIDVLVRKEDSPKINRVMELLQYNTMESTTIESEINKDEIDTELFEPVNTDPINLDFLDDIMPDGDRSNEGEKKAVEPPIQEKAGAEQEPFFSEARTKKNPSGPGLDSINSTEKKASEPPSVKEEIMKIRWEQKEKARSQKEEPQRGKATPQQITRHQQPPNKRKPKSKNIKER